FCSIEHRFGAGGHPKAAAASVRISGEEDPVEEATELMTELIQNIANDQIFEPEPVAEDFMTSPVLSCTLNATISQQAEGLLDRHGFYALPVVDADSMFKGFISRVEIAKALRSDVSDAANRPVSGFMLNKVLQVSPSAPMHHIRKDMAESSSGGRAVVVDVTGKVRGVITRTDLLRQYHFYKCCTTWGRQRSSPALHEEWVGAAAEPG
ncbi:unnamed protein product, partial [Choristocarpus tenellus]